METSESSGGRVCSYCGCTRADSHSRCPRCGNVFRNDPEP